MNSWNTFYSLFGIVGGFFVGWVTFAICDYIVRKGLNNKNKSVQK